MECKRVSYEIALCVQRLKAVGKQQGFLTYDQINAGLPSEIVDPEDIASIVKQVESAGIQVVETLPIEKT